MRIRDATAIDVPTINALYNALIPSTTIAWTDDLTPLSEHEEWFERQAAAGNPVIVAEDDGEVVGYTTYGPFSDSIKWPGYRFTAELTVHVAEAKWGKGVGGALLEELIGRARAAGKHVLVAGVDGDNEASIRLHERLGFEVTARMPEVGRKFDRWLDLVYLQLVLDP